MTRAAPVLSLLFALVLSLLPVSPAGAQQVFGVPWIPPEFLDDERSLDDDELTFCLNSHSAMVDFDRAVAQALADVLLVNAVFHEMVYPTAPYLYDYRLPMSEAELFLSITNECDVFMGFRLTPDSIPDWLTVSRPYLLSEVVFFSADPAIRSFDRIPAGTQIGVRLGATGHRELRTYMQALPQDRRPRQIPYPNNELLLERLTDGSVPVIMAWEYAPSYASGGDITSLGIVASFTPPFPVPALQFAVAMLERDTFVRGLIDDAIAELEASGELETLAAEYLPAAESP